MNKGLLLRLPRELALWLSAAAKEKGVTRQEYIRGLLEKERKAPKVKAMFEQKAIGGLGV